MKSVLRISGLFGLFLVLTYLVCHFLDTSPNGQTDGLIKGVAYVNVLWLVSIWWVISSLLALGFRAKSGLLQSLAFYTTSALGTLVFLEGLCWILVSLGIPAGVGVTNHRLYIPANIENPITYAGDVSPFSGRWRLPNAREQVVNCSGDTLRRYSNELGAADDPYTSDTTTNRVIVLGDSYMEGYMVNPADRMSTRLSKATGHRHLNFAINGTSPINYWQTYRQFSHSVAHKAVLVGLLPANDFEDYNGEKVHAQVDFPIYRPYWTNDSKLAYSLANIHQSIGAVGRTRASLLQTVDSVYQTLTWKQKARVHFVEHSYLAQTLLKLAQNRVKVDAKWTRYAQFSEAEWNTMTHSMDQLKQDAAGKSVIFVSLPIMLDVKALRAGADNKFDRQMRTFCQQRGIGFISLVPHALAYKGNIADLYVPCDGHWTAKGEAWATECLLKEEAYLRVVK
ncbi:SGNH/GDSL hydrolase family protein [Fibrella sp. HMF5335]|uniref:SGNH/GDSL hydrolase family protein n=1 Tax=Fibrella rubiginis TaxID=2817060 RepID=A0A939K0F5_9BACT|nr:SGNH/GDSL hydrolase family protein [Fibrella rubiginis]MBO0936037.1 SGNH/GDSL hydrolase family protein [Fibrella rubiginis]